jgi:hypothetical protein
MDKEVKKHPSFHRRNKKYIILPIKTNYCYTNNTINNECREYLCKRKIFNKKQRLCEKHYSQSRRLMISTIVPNCIYSDNCNLKIFRKLLCYLHYKKYKENDSYTRGIVMNYLRKLNRKT